MDVGSLPLRYRIPLLLLPWAFVAIVILVFVMFIWPRAMEGHSLAIAVAIFLVAVISSSLTAAVVFSRDVISGRYPRRAGESHRP